MIILQPNYPTYPPYHQGLYLEDYFTKFYFDHKEEFLGYREFIPISWTTAYIEGKDQPIQPFLDSLDQNKRYFAVSQHDDAIKETLPIDTLHFSAGGKLGDIPIPLICSQMTNIKHVAFEDKDIYCSFVGSITHSLRSDILCRYAAQEGWFMSGKMHNPQVKDFELQNFIDITQRSKFALAIRGYGPTSFRLYEIMQLGAVPVYVSDKFWLPFQDVIDWDRLCVFVSPEEIDIIPDILRSYSDYDIKKMLDYAREMSHLFTLEGTCLQILNTIKKHDC